MFLFLFFSFFLVPELDESALASSLNGIKDFGNISLNNSIDNLNSSSSNNISSLTMNKQASSNRLASRASQNELLTLPPINEAQISNNNNNNNSSKKRIDSGIDTMHEGHSGAVWTLSPNGSDNNDTENSNNATNYRNTATVITTTVEIMETPSMLKKNATSSTLNSFGKSSSIQSKLTHTTNNSQSSKSKFNLSATSTAPSSANKANAIANSSEQEYIDSIVRLHTLPDNNNTNSNNNDDYIEMNQSKFKLEPSSKQQQQSQPHHGSSKNLKNISMNGSINNLDVSSYQNDDYVYYSNISNGNVSNQSQNYYQVRIVL